MDQIMGHLLAVCVIAGERCHLVREWQNKGLSPAIDKLYLFRERRKNAERRKGWHRVKITCKSGR